MAEYINRTDAVKIAEKYGLGNGHVLGRHTGLADCIASEISGLPAADVAPMRHGRWIHETIEDDWGGTYHSWSCSECKFSVGRNPTDGNYCPNCGAKMDLE